MVDIEKIRESFETLVKSVKDVAGIDLSDFEGFFPLKAALLNYWEKRNDGLLTVGDLIVDLQKFKENAVVCLYDYGGESGSPVKGIMTVTQSIVPHFSSHSWWELDGDFPDAVVCITGVDENEKDILDPYYIMTHAWIPVYQAEEEVKKMAKLVKKEHENG